MNKNSTEGLHTNPVARQSRVFKLGCFSAVSTNKLDVCKQIREGGIQMVQLGKKDIFDCLNHQNGQQGHGYH